MEFSDESYVRLYTRKTLTSKLLGWEGRAVMHAMMGEFDAAGLFPLRGDPARCIAAVTDIPEDVARIGLERLVETETWQVNGKLLVWPTFERAQNCCRSDRLRQRESRARRLAEAVTNRDGMSRDSVTDVTAGHGESQPVTNCHPPSAPSLPPFAPNTTTSGQTTGKGGETLRLAKGLASSSDPAQSLETTLAPGKDLPESSTGIPTVIREIPDGFSLPEDIRQDARILGLSDTEIDHYWGELCKGPIGGKRGILQKRFAKYLKDLPKQWRVWAEVARSSNTIGRSGASKGRYGSSPVWEPKSSHVAFCAKYGISPERMAEMARDYVNSGEPEQRGGKRDADDAFTKRLQAEVTKKRKAAG